MGHCLLDFELVEVGKLALPLLAARGVVPFINSLRIASDLAS